MAPFTRKVKHDDEPCRQPDPKPRKQPAKPDGKRRKEVGFAAPSFKFVASNYAVHIPIAAYRRAWSFTGTQHDDLSQRDRLTGLPLWIARSDDKHRKIKLAIDIWLKDKVRLHGDPVCTYTVIDKEQACSPVQQVFGNAPDAMFESAQRSTKPCGRGRMREIFEIKFETVRAWYEAMKSAHSIIKPAVRNRPRYCGRVVIEYQLISKIPRDGYVFNAEANGYLMNFYDVCLVYWRTTQKEKAAAAAAARAKIEVTTDECDSSCSDSSDDEEHQRVTKKRSSDAAQLDDDDDSNVKRTKRRSCKQVVSSDSESEDDESDDDEVDDSGSESSENSEVDDDEMVQVDEDRLLQTAVFARLKHKYVYEHLPLVPKKSSITDDQANTQSDNQQSVNQSNCQQAIDESDSQSNNQSNNQPIAQSDSLTQLSNTDCMFMPTELDLSNVGYLSPSPNHSTSRSTDQSSHQDINTFANESSVESFVSLVDSAVQQVPSSQAMDQSVNQSNNRPRRSLRRRC